MMNGRQENDKQINERVLKKLSKYPAVFTEYYSWLIHSGKTFSTANLYVEAIIGLYNNLASTEQQPDFYRNTMPEHIRAYLNAFENSRFAQAGECSNAASATKWSALNSFFTYLKPILGRNPLEDIPRPTITRVREMVYLSNDELQHIFNNARNSDQQRSRNRDIAIMMLGFYRGLSSSAIRNLNISDLELDKNRVWIADKDKRYVVSLSAQITEQLQLWLYDREVFCKGDLPPAVFVSQKGTRLSGDALNNIVTKYAKGLGKSVSAQVMKNTCVINLYKQTGDISLCAKFLKHKGTTTTQRYIDELLAGSANSVHDANKIMSALLENQHSNAGSAASQMIMTTKTKCALIRAIRKEIAQLNGIEYQFVDCPNSDTCTGTCSITVAEILLINTELTAKAKSGQKINVAGISLVPYIGTYDETYTSSTILDESNQLSLF